MSEYDVNIPEYVWKYDNRQGSEYILLVNVQQVNEYLLRDGHIQHLVRDER